MDLPTPEARVAVLRACVCVFERVRERESLWTEANFTGPLAHRAGSSGEEGGAVHWLVTQVLQRSCRRRRAQTRDE